MEVSWLKLCRFMANESDQTKRNKSQLVANKQRDIFIHLASLTVFMSGRFNSHRNIRTEKAA